MTISCGDNLFRCQLIIIDSFNRFWKCESRPVAFSKYCTLHYKPCQTLVPCLRMTMFHTAPAAAQHTAVPGLAAHHPAVVFRPSPSQHHSTMPTPSWHWGTLVLNSGYSSMSVYIILSLPYTAMFEIISKHIRKDPCLNLYFLCKLENYLNQTTFNDTNYPIISTALVEFSQWKYETKHFVIMHFISNNIIIKCFSWTVWRQIEFYTNH